MKPKVKWIEKKFDFDFSVDLVPELLEKLRNAPVRLRELVKDLSQDVLIKPEGDKWSIQENAGHLWSVESLFLGRLDDYEANLKELQPADMTNKRTEEAGYNKFDIDIVLDGFREQRAKFLRRLEEFVPEDFAKSAFHPRLKKQMRICDMLYFMVEHDEHHLERIKDLKRCLLKRKIVM